ncbi:MAG: menaquinone-dependent protoporphyrinogen IX dehydrogenase [Rhodanobacter sp.]|jgi:menaquinone-dependent protoporphyrinogen oxidase
MSRTLIAYSTIDGHTLKICARLKQWLEDAGHSATLLEIVEGVRIDANSFDQIVVGASIRYGKHRPAVFSFIDANRLLLESKPSAFFSVNVVARKPGKDAPTSNPYIKAFRRKTTWSPREVAVFAGKIDYPKYGFLDREVIRFIMWLTHGPIDRTARVDFTDWQAVERFARRIGEMGSGEVGAAAHLSAGQVLTARTDASSNST